MTQTEFSCTVDILTSPMVVWSVMADVERWSEWTASVSCVKLVALAPLQIGSRVRIHQPKMPPAFWRVTELIPNGSFTWISGAPHAVQEIADGARATLSVRYEGFLGSLLTGWVGDLNERYLAWEANGLKARCVALAEKQLAQNL